MSSVCMFDFHREWQRVTCQKQIQTEWEKHWLATIIVS